MCTHLITPVSVMRTHLITPVSVMCTHLITPVSVMRTHLITPVSVMRTQITFMMSLLHVPPQHSRLPRSLSTTALKEGDEILEINGVPIIEQDQKEVGCSELGSWGGPLSPYYCVQWIGCG